MITRLAVRSLGTMVMVYVMNSVFTGLVIIELVAHVSYMTYFQLLLLIRNLRLCLQQSLSHDQSELWIIHCQTRFFYGGWVSTGIPPERK